MFLLFDIGGTKMRLARSSDGLSFDTPAVVETPRLYEDGIALFIKTAHELAGGASYEAIAGGIAGPFGEKKGSLLTSPNLKGWIGKPFRADLIEAFNIPVSIENDSALVALGEATAGAAVGERIVAYITVSTGVGGARIVNGTIDEKAVGFEPGHQIIDADKTLVPDANDIFLGDYISGKWVEKRFGKKPYEIEDVTLWNETLPRLLAYGLNNVAVFWSPDTIVLGGSMIIGEKGSTINITATEKYFKEILAIFPETPTLKKATLGDFGGLYGALALIKKMA